MPQNFIIVDRDQDLLLAPSLDEWLPEDHLARFVVDAVAQMDLGVFYRAYHSAGRGGAAFDPAAMLGLLIYSYCTGMTSSRKIEAACVDQVAQRWIMANARPDHVTIARFRARHQKAFKRLFIETLVLCRKAGMAKVGTVALDGTKMAGNAARSKTVGKEAIAKQVLELVDAAKQVDKEEDTLFGKDDNGDPTPPQLRGRAQRLARLKQAKAQLEAEEVAEIMEDGKRAATRRAAEKKGEARGPAPKPASEKAGYKPPRVNTTDPDSRLLKSHNGWVQGYNFQAVANEHQIILAADIVQDANDQRQLEPMTASLAETLAAAGIEEPVGALLADAGYASTAVLDAFEARAAAGEAVPDLYVATRNTRRNPQPRNGTRGPLPAGATSLDRMDRKVSSKPGKTLYKMRQWMVEPVFGQIKGPQGITRIARRGLDPAKSEIDLIAATHNLRKLYLAGAKFA